MALSTAGDDTVPQHSSGPPCHSLQSAGCFWRFHKQFSNRPNAAWDELGHLRWCPEGGDNSCRVFESPYVKFGKGTSSRSRGQAPS